MLILAIWIKLYKVEVNDLVINVLLCCAMIILLGISVEFKSGWVKELYYGMTEERMKEWMEYRERSENNE